ATAVAASAVRFFWSGCIAGGRLRLVRRRRLALGPGAALLGLACLQGALVTLLYGSHLWTKPKGLSEKVSVPEAHASQGDSTPGVIILETVSQEMPNTSPPATISKEQAKAPA
ncbi:MAG: hypothetical protein K2X66_09715, partial [Cyanobacteria bacterium]|nr:hypothetical protein [Cyanobacteriota bacterium]